MRKECPVRTAISTLADRQLGHVTRAQLAGLGVASGWIRSQMRLGWLIRVHAGVYAVGHVPHPRPARALAAVLACGPGAVASHASAAALWGVGSWPPVPEITGPREHRRPGIRSHRSSTLSAAEIRHQLGVPVTSPARTVLDLQPRLSDARLARTVNDLRIAGHLSPSAFAELCARSRRLRTLLGDGEPPATRSGDRPTRSALEDLFRAFVTRHEIPMPLINARLAENDREVDALYRDPRLIIELDSWTFHGDRASFERDRAKDARALADGYRTLRITARRLAHGGAAEARTIRRILDATP